MSNAPTVQTNTSSSGSPSPPSPTTAGVEAIKIQLIKNLKDLDDTAVEDWLKELYKSTHRPNFAPKASVVYAICDMLLDLVGHLKLVHDQKKPHASVIIDNIELETTAGVTKARIKLDGLKISGGYKEDMTGLLALVKFLLTEKLDNCVPPEVAAYLKQVDAGVKEPTEEQLASLLNAIKDTRFSGMKYSWQVIQNATVTLTGTKTYKVTMFAADTASKATCCCVVM